MIKKNITYTDYNGVERSEDFYFHLSTAELRRMEVEATGGLEATINRLIAEQDPKKIYDMIEDVICRSYGKKSPDGKKFLKSKEILEDLTSTEAFSVLTDEFFMNPDTFADFINGIVGANKASIVEKHG